MPGAGYRSGVEKTGDDHLVLADDTTVEFGDKTLLDLPRGSIVGDQLQFARQPFLVALQAGWLKLVLCTVHIYYGKGRAGLARRNAEIRALTKFLAKRAQSEKDSDANNFFVVLGDFNIVGRDHATMKSLTTNDFDVPEALQSVPGTNVPKDKAYDQIAYWTGKGKWETVTMFEVARAGVFDFFETVYTDADEEIYKPLMEKESWKYKDWRTFQMSDHLPMWIELRTDFAEEYLASLAE